MVKPHFPSREDIIAFIKDSDSPPTKRQIAKAFRISGEDRIALKKIVRELQNDGILPGGRKQGGSKHRRPASDVVEMEILGFNPGGELQAKPLDLQTEQPEEGGKPFILPFDSKEETPTPGTRVLVRVTNEQTREVTLLRALPDRLTHVLGIFHGAGEHGQVEPVQRAIKETFVVPKEHTEGAQDGELVYCQLLHDHKPQRGKGRQKGPLSAVKVLERVGRLDSPRSASMIAIQNQDIPMEFSREALAIANNAKDPELSGTRVDLRDIPLVTIDGADARDFDDAVWAEADPDTPGGYHLVVAIADVAHYVRYGEKLDDEAFLRGNSVYFPDRVVPMLPEALSNGLCSLNPKVDRFCMAVHLWINAEGETTRYQFVRGMMKSRARLTYEQVQAAHDGNDTDLDQELVETIIKPLYGVFAVLEKARQRRGTLDLDLPEHRIHIDEKTGEVDTIAMRERLDSHKLIEECMIAANVAAANAIEQAEAHGLFRVHEQPDYERLQDLSTFLKYLGYSFKIKSEVQPSDFSGVLKQSLDKPEEHVIHMSILRSQSAAYYHPKNLGHFGLALDEYTHFTSPIRRYSDLIVHRSLINIFDMHDKARDGLNPDQAKNLNAISTHISHTERRAMLAEREANDRYITNFMAHEVGKEFDAIIATVTSFGFFIEIRENGVQGLVPARSIRGDFWIYDREKQRLIGRSTGETFQLGQKVRVMLVEADTLTGSLQFAVSGRGARVASGKRPPGKKPYRGGKPRNDGFGKGKSKGQTKGKKGKGKPPKKAGKSGKQRYN